MNVSYVSIIARDSAIYPNKMELFRPHHIYPEYLFSNDISGEENYVYDMVRESLKELKLDEENYGTEHWNPLGEFVKPGDNVLLKPNLVSEKNHNPTGSVECVYTHPSVTAAVIDYVLIAMRGRGELVIGDAPVQECRFDKLIDESGYKDLIQWYRNKDINIKLVDLRSSSNQSNTENLIQYPQGMVLRENGVLVELNENSAFCDISEDMQQRMRVTNFDPRILQQHHIGTRHAYMLAKELLEADVIINLPKPKTHKIAGITGAQKNMFGVCANKDYLPHYTLGGKDENGDAYLHKNPWLSVAANIMDIKNIFNRENLYEKARRTAEFYCMLRREGHIERNKEPYENGCWYGNDTIWRTIADINRVVLYADKNGVMQHNIQRKMFIVGDMIVSGEKEGPLAPTDYKSRLIVAGDDALAFDRVICAIMGFDEQQIPQLNADNMRPSYMPFQASMEPLILSNIFKRKSVKLMDIKSNMFNFSPASSWEYVLGNPTKNKMLDSVVLFIKGMIIFGAGINGVIAYNYVRKWYSNITIIVFWDNDVHKQNKCIVDNIKCIAPRKALDGEVCLICANSRFLPSMYMEAKEKGFTDRNILIFGSNFIGNGIGYKI